MFFTLCAPEVLSEVFPFSVSELQQMPALNLLESAPETPPSGLSAPCSVHAQLSIGTGVQSTPVRVPERLCHSPAPHASARRRPSHWDPERWSFFLYPVR